MNYRIGKITSSKAGLLMANGRGVGGFSAQALTYFQEKKLERKLKKSFSTDEYSKPIIWGKVMEIFCINQLNTNQQNKIYWRVSTTHKVGDEELSIMAGATDCLTHNEIGEVKCYGLKKFAQYSEALKTQDIEFIKSEWPMEYWQGIHNSILYKCEKISLIAYAPYANEMSFMGDIIELTDFCETHNFQPWQVRFILEESPDNLPCLPSDSEIKDLNIFTFDAPESDVKEYIKRVKEAEKIILEL